MKSIAVILLAVLAGFLPACSLVDSHEKTFDSIRGMGSELASRMPIKTSQLQVNAHGTNPGVRFSAGTEYYVQGQYTGLAGSFSAAGVGEGDLKNSFTPEDQARINAIYQDQSLTEARREQLIKDILTQVFDRLAAKQAASAPAE